MDVDSQADEDDMQISLQTQSDEWSVKNQKIVSSTPKKSKAKEIFDKVVDGEGAAGDNNHVPTISLKELLEIEEVGIDNQAKDFAIKPMKWTLDDKTSIVLRKNDVKLKDKEFSFIAINFIRVGNDKTKAPFCFSLNARAHLDQTIRILQNAKDYLSNPEKFQKKKSK